VLSRQILGEILEPRVEEVFSLIQEELVRAGYENMINSGVVITGGSAELPGFRRLQSRFSMSRLARDILRGSAAWWRSSTSRCMPPP